jgi:hypothetical protein
MIVVFSLIHDAFVSLVCLRSYAMCVSQLFKLLLSLLAWSVYIMMQHDNELR